MTRTEWEQVLWTVKLGLEMKHQRSTTMPRFFDVFVLSDMIHRRYRNNVTCIRKILFYIQRGHLSRLRHTPFWSGLHPPQPIDLFSRSLYTYDVHLHTEGEGQNYPKFTGNNAKCMQTSCVYRGYHHSWNKQSQLSSEVILVSVDLNYTMWSGESNASNWGTSWMVPLSQFWKIMIIRYWAGIREIQDGNTSSEIFYHF